MSPVPGHRWPKFTEVRVHGDGRSIVRRHYDDGQGDELVVEQETEGDWTGHPIPETDEPLPEPEAPS